MTQSFDEIRHFIFSQLEIGLYQMVALKKEANGDQNYYGKLISVNFIVDKDKTVQRCIFEKHTGDNILKPEQEKEFCSIIQVDLKTEREVCKAIFCRLDIATQKVHIERILNDGTKDKKVI